MNRRTCASRRTSFITLRVKIADLLLDGSARLEQRSDRSYQLRTALDQLLGSHGEDIELGTADHQAEVFEKAANMGSKMTGVDVKRPFDD